LFGKIWEDFMSAIDNREKPLATDGFLLRHRGFAPLFWCQLFSAFSDNLLKNALVFVILFKTVLTGSDALIALAGVVFIAPFFLLSGLGGELADKFDKAQVARHLKFVELGAAALAVVGFALTSVPILFAALFIFGVISTLFSPIKYGILPDYLPEDRLAEGNAFIESATFAAILVGAIMGGLLVGVSWAVFGLVIGISAILSWLSTLAMPSVVAADVSITITRNVLRSTSALLVGLKADRRIFWGALVTSWFWLMGAVLVSLLPVIAKTVLHGSENLVTAFLMVFAIGIALGSALAAWMSKGRIVLLPAAAGAVLMGIFAIDIGFAVRSAESAALPTSLLANFQAIRIMIDLGGLAISGGLLIVPSFAAIQAWSNPAHRARVIAGVNVMNAAFMLAGGVALAIFQQLGLTTGVILWVVGVSSSIAGAAITVTLPTSGLADFLSILFRAFYRMEVTGMENLAKAGPNAIIVLNHTSFLDAAMALSLLDKKPVFAIDSGISRRWWVRPFLRLTKALPIDPSRPLATRALINAVKAGDTLVIFPEGRITVTGSLMKVYDGVGLIADKAGAQIVPVHLDGLEATSFSRLTSAQVRKRWFPKVAVKIMEPVKLQVAEDLRGKHRRKAAGSALYEVMSDLIFRAANTDQTIFAALVGAADKHGLTREAVEDPVTGSLSYKRLLTGIRLIGSALERGTVSGEAVGVMLPSSNAATVTIFGLVSAGRVPAMINFTAGLANIEAACTAAKIKKIVTSRAFIEQGKLKPLITGLAENREIVHLEDIRSSFSGLSKIRALLQCKKAIAKRQPDDPAVILFTSGSEGTPKGVVLSHRNILSNVAQAGARIDFGRTDKVFNVLPVFHSFGLTAGLILPLLSGVKIFLYPSPLHYRMVPELIYQTNSTILFGTDTFLSGYAKTADAYDLRSVRYIFAGAEPVRETTRFTYMERFQKTVFEGYGVTETAPVLAINTPMFNRFGTVGRLMPGMEARLEPVPGVEEGGRLHIRGPNVMVGYLQASNPGVITPPEEGWHDTGDIVTVDAQGFIRIRGRAKRFAKIAGEMISLAAIEALAAELWPASLSAVTAIPDQKKGERLVLVTDAAHATRSDFQRFAKDRGATEMMVPADVLVRPNLPILGSGKIDHGAIRKLVLAEISREVAI
jgi:acyl-[acyl-carrier-protein]-phospholipid O-acyltransferase/long-chain-fatty-acid--[acyl-carrier-protein] ligase